MLDYSPRRWMFFRTGTSLWFPAPARRRSISRLRNVEAIEARCLLSASGLISDLIANQSGSESKPLHTLQNLPSVENAANSSTVAASVQKLITETTNELHHDLSPAIVSDAVEPRETTGVSSTPVVTVSVSIPSVSSKTYVGYSGWKITFYFRPKSDSPLGSSLGSSMSNSDRGQSSLRRNLVESSFTSTISERADQRSNNDSGKTLLLDWSSMSTDPVVASGATASAIQRSAAMIASDASSTDAQAMESQSAVAIASTAETSEDFAAAGRSTVERQERFALLTADALSDGVTNSSGTSGSLPLFQNSLTTFFTNEQIAGRYDAAAARPVTMPQTAPRESDLILTGKQGPKLVAESDENPDTFFLRHSFKFLLSPEREAEQQRLDQNKPNVPGSEGNVDPGHAPQNGKDAPAPSRDGADDDMKEGSMTWAGLLLAAASGFRSIRNRRNRQRDAA